MRTLYSFIRFKKAHTSKARQVQIVFQKRAKFKFKIQNIKRKSIAGKFPYEVRIVVPRPTTTTTISTNRVIKKTDDISLRKSSKDATYHNSPMPLTKLSDVAWTTCLIMLPIIILAIVISPCLLYYCDPTRRSQRAKKLQRLKSIQKERDDRWKIPEEFRDRSININDPCSSDTDLEIDHGSIDYRVEDDETRNNDESEI